MLLQSQPANEAVRGWLHLGPNQDSKSRRRLGLCCVRNIPRRRWNGLGVGRSINKKQGLTAEDVQIVGSDNTK